MTLNPATLIQHMETALDPDGATDATITASDYPTRLAEAYGKYMEDAVSAGPILTPNIPNAVAAMAAAMSFPEQSQSAGATAFAAGYGAFWAYIVANFAQFWAVAIIVPPTFASLPSDLNTQMGVNNDPAITVAQAATNLGTVIAAATLVSPTTAIPPASPIPIT